MNVECPFWSSKSQIQRERHWRRHAWAIEQLGNINGLAEAVRELGATSGLVSLAAISGKTVPEAVRCFPDFQPNRQASRIDMEAALVSANLTFNRKPKTWPEEGLCLIQFTRSLTGPGFGHAKNDTHWVAILGEYVFDINWGGWLPHANWEDVVLYEILASKPESDEWRVVTSYEVLVNIRPSVQALAL